MTPRWTQRPPGSNWGDFGPDDQRGRMNLLTPERRRQAMKEVITGEVFCLSLPLDYPGGNVLNPRRHPPTLRATGDSGRQVGGYFAMQTRFSQVMTISVFATLIAGFLMYGLDSNWFSSPWMMSSVGTGFGDRKSTRLNSSHRT